jgi:hypothetical protein
MVRQQNTFAQSELPIVLSHFVTMSHLAAEAPVAQDHPSTTAQINKGTPFATWIKDGFGQ